MLPFVDGPRHDASWYRRRPQPVDMEPGTRLFVPCDGGPCQSRLEAFPPRLEIDEREGMYVLVDDGPVDEWRYVYIERRVTLA
jgi:hypothetical protein